MSAHEVHVYGNTTQVLGQALIERGRHHFWVGNTAALEKAPNRLPELKKLPTLDAD